MNTLASGGLMSSQVYVCGLRESRHRSALGSHAPTARLFNFHAVPVLADGEAMSTAKNTEQRPCLVIQARESKNHRKTRLQAATRPDSRGGMDTFSLSVNHKTKTQKTNMDTTNTNTPTIDTSEYDAVSTYEPSIPEGLHTVPGVILDFGPAIKRDDGSYQGWSVTFALAEEVSDDSGGKLPVGKRMGPYTIFTTESQYRNTGQCVKDAAINLQGLNGIVRDKAADPRFEKADGAFKALAGEKKLPLRVDTEPAHYEQWKGTACKFLLKRKGDNVNLLQILATATPAGAKSK